MPLYEHYGVGNDMRLIIAGVGGAVGGLIVGLLLGFTLSHGP